MSTTEKRNIKLILILIFCIVMVIPHIIITVVIFRKRRLRRVRFYIIANLSVGDIVTLFVISAVVINAFIVGKLIESVLDDYFFIVGRTILIIVHFYSLFTLVLLAVDRYIAVKFSLEYENMMRGSRLICGLTILWVLSIAIAGFQWINVTNLSDLLYHRRIILILVRSNVSVLLLIMSKYTQLRRIKHMKKIKERENYFGVTKEKLDRLQQIKRSLGDSFKLYVITIVILIIISALELSFSQYHFEINMIGVPLLLVTNVIIVSLTQREIRSELKRVLFPYCYRRIGISHKWSSRLGTFSGTRDPGL